MEAFLEILKYTIPSLVVFATAYFLLKQHLDDRTRVALLEQRQEATKMTLPLRLQAYERLTILCDRVSVTNVLLRVRSAGMTAGDLRGAMMLTVSQEFDHNTSQQLYVSDTLWQIISLAKNDTLAILANTVPDLDPQAPDTQFVEALLQVVDERGPATPLQRAIIAIRTEAGQLF